MIHRNDERVFRVVELACYAALIVAVPVLRAMRKDSWPYFMPVVLTAVSAVGLVFMTRYFIYAQPHLISSRTRAEIINLSRDTKIALAVGYAMCVPMFALGCLGLLNPAAIERIIRAISPMRFILD